MRQIVVLPSFERTRSRLKRSENIQVSKALAKFNDFLMTGVHPVGFGYKKLGVGKYEFRAGIRLRIIVRAVEDVHYLVLVGSHDDVRHFLRTS